jgi:hypothetical protein
VGGHNQLLSGRGVPTVFEEEYKDEVYATQQNRGPHWAPVESKWHSYEYYDDDVDMYNCVDDYIARI